MQTIYKFKKGEIKFFIYEGTVRKGEIIGMTTYLHKEYNGEKNVNLYFLQTSDVKKNSETIIFERREESIYDTKLDCFKIMDKTH